MVKLEEIRRTSRMWALANNIGAGGGKAKPTVGIRILNLRMSQIRKMGKIGLIPF